MSHEAAIAVALLIPLGAALTIGKYAIPAFAAVFAAAAVGEQAGWWHAGWILGEGPKPDFGVPFGEPASTAA